MTKLRSGEVKLRKARKKEEMYLSGMNYSEDVDLTESITENTEEKASKKIKKVKGTNLHTSM